MLEVLARIRHRRTRRQLSPYLDGMLSAQESRRLEAHLAQCQACRDELAELQATIQSLAELPLAEAPRSFALAAAPRRVEAPRPAARRLEFGLRLATVAAAFVLAVVAVGDLLGVPGGEEEEAPAEMALRAAPTVAGTPSVPAEAQTSEGGAEDKSVTEAPTAPPAAAGGAEGEATPAPAATYGESAPGTGTPSSQPPVLAPSAPPGVAVPGVAQAETPAPIATTAPAPVPTEAPVLAGTPAAAPETPAATPTPPPVGAQIAPSEPEQQPPPEAERQPLAAEEGGPSRETVVRWLEIGLATGLALLFASWVLARRRGRA